MGECNQDFSYLFVEGGVAKVEKLIGSGTFGEIYTITDIKNNKLAVKCCKIDSSRTLNLLELSIMSTYIHPNINRSLFVKIMSDCVYIVQNLAICDLFTYSRLKNKNAPPDLELLKHWSFSIAQGVNVLHKEDIIHGDIKATNILMFSDRTIKLADFGFSIKKPEKDSYFSHIICTSTHRPIESLVKNRKWNESLDIWSLGCTFYEIAYGEYLFPRQETDKKIPRQSTDKMINAILDWAVKGPNREILNIERPSTTDYKKIQRSPNYDLQIMDVYNDLICKMLFIRAGDRLNISEVLTHRFFEGSQIVNGTRLSKIPIIELTVDQQARITRFIEIFCENYSAEKIAYNLYLKSENFEMSEKQKALICSEIANRMCKPGISSKSMNEDEIMVCSNMQFLLHS